MHQPLDGPFHTLFLWYLLILEFQHSKPQKPPPEIPLSPFKFPENEK